MTLPRLLLSAFFGLILFPVLAIAQGFGSPSLYGYRAQQAEPMQVGVGLQVDQITFVDQQSENFGVVGSLFLKLELPELAYHDEVNAPPFKLFTVEEFQDLASEAEASLPYFIFRNQQGRRFVQQETVVLKPDGTTTYSERFTVTLQAPHFDFTHFPFDRQNFFVEISSLLPASVIQFYPLPEQTGMGDMLGEEEWIIYNPRLTEETVEGLGGSPTSVVALGFSAKRHLQYYMMRIMLPLLIILFVSWATFFLQEYRRRVDMANANLLVFVAFNFAISSTLPRLGYLTFMDILLVGMFIITGSMVLVNIALRRLKLNDREAQARKIDSYLVIWVYPLVYAGFLFWAVRFYLF